MLAVELLKGHLGSTLYQAIDGPRQPSLQQIQCQVAQSLKIIFPSLWNPPESSIGDKLMQCFLILIASHLHKPILDINEPLDPLQP